MQLLLKGGKISCCVAKTVMQMSGPMCASSKKSMCSNTQGSQNDNISFQYLLINCCHIIFLYTVSTIDLTCTTSGAILYGLLSQFYFRNMMSASFAPWANSSASCPVTPFTLQLPCKINTFIFLISPTPFNYLYFQITFYVKSP